MPLDYSRHYARSHPDTAEHNVGLQNLMTRWLEPHLPERDCEIFDVGCGRGYALDWLRRKGYTRLHGIDPDAGQIVYAKNLGLQVEQVDDSTAYLTSRPENFDFVLLMDVLEHVSHERQLPLLRAIHGALRPGGRLLCTVPNANSPAASHWRHFDYTHQLLFTTESLEFVLTQAGFQVPKLQGLEFIAPPRWCFWPPRKVTFRWWLRQFARIQPRLTLTGELGWKAGWRVPLSPNLLAIAVRL